MPEGQGGITSVEVNLPDEFKGKNPTITVSVRNVELYSTSGSSLWCVRYWNCKGSVNNNKATISGMLSYGNPKEDRAIYKNSYLTIAYTVVA